MLGDLCMYRPMGGFEIWYLIIVQGVLLYTTAAFVWGGLALQPNVFKDAAVRRNSNRATVGRFHTAYGTRPKVMYGKTIPHSFQPYVILMCHSRGLMDGTHTAHIYVYVFGTVPQTFCRSTLK